ncbi:MAG: MlaD family protein [Thermodesulfobacteriota bacterium]
MSRKPNFFKVGAFVIIGLVIFVMAIIIFGGRKFFREKVFFETYFDQSVQGLSVGATVKVLGVEVGAVDKITFAETIYNTEENIVVVRGFFYPDAFGRHGITEDQAKAEIGNLIKQGFRLQLASQGITGLAFLNGVFFQPGQYPPYKIDWKPKYMYVPSAPSTITTIADAVTELTRRLNEINFKEISDDVQKLLEVTTKAVEDAKIATLSQELQDTTLEFKKVASDLDSILESEELQRSLKDLNLSLENIKIASKDLPDAAAELRTILRRLDNLVGRRQQEITLILDNIAVISEDIRQFMNLAKDYPSWILFGNPPPKLDEVSK